MADHQISRTSDVYDFLLYFHLHVNRKSRNISIADISLDVLHNPGDSEKALRITGVNIARSFLFNRHKVHG